MAKEKIFFMSDAHLQGVDSPSEEKKHTALRSFLTMVRNEARTLYILGDYFDFWFEYKHVLPKQCFMGVHWLMDLSEAGVEIHYVTGNHDHWIGQFFEKNLKIAVHHEPLTVSINGKKIFLLHGDGISGRDKSYRIMKKILRSRFNIFLFRWLHPDLGVPLATAFSHMSNRQDRTYKKYIGDRSIDGFFQKKFDEGMDIVVMGHHHLPQEKFFGAKKYVNLGDWISHFSYAEWERDTVVLKKIE